ncbi:hypothetical protein [Stenotrophomonas phage RAS14]
MYTLILTLMLVAPHSYESSASIHNVDGFKSEAGCLAAGNAWIAQQKNRKYTYQIINAHALCVKQ